MNFFLQILISICKDQWIRFLSMKNRKCHPIYKWKISTSYLQYLYYLRNNFVIIHVLFASLIALLTIY